MSHKKESAAQAATAYHEAGHAVIAMRLGYRCRYVTIVPKGDKAGCACCEDPMKGDNEKKVEHALKMLMAAQIAESKHTGLISSSHSGDRVHELNIAIEATDRDDPQTTDELLMRMRGQAHGLVDEHWAEIHALAQRLLVEKTVLLAS
jgi:hypothetical protein